MQSSTVPCISWQVSCWACRRILMEFTERKLFSILWLRETSVMKSTAIQQMQVLAISDHPCYFQQVKLHEAGRHDWTTLDYPEAANVDACDLRHSMPFVTVQSCYCRRETMAAASGRWLCRVFQKPHCRHGEHRRPFWRSNCSCPVSQRICWHREGSTKYLHSSFSACIACIRILAVWSAWPLQGCSVLQSCKFAHKGTLQNSLANFWNLPGNSDPC